MRGECRGLSLLFLALGLYLHEAGLACGSELGEGVVEFELRTLGAGVIFRFVLPLVGYACLTPCPPSRGMVFFKR